MKKRFLSTLVFGAVLASVSLARAHFVWIEPAESKEIKLFFGEYNNQRRETSPGALDRITGVEAWVNPGGDKAEKLEVKKAPDAFILASGQTVESVWAQDESVAVSDRAKPPMPVTKSNFYARYVSDLSREVKPRMALDIVPSGKEKNAFVICFKGKPLADVSVSVFSPNGWAKEFKSDAAGVLKIETPFKGGIYVLEAAHREKAAGTFREKAYQETRYVSSLSFKVE